MGALLWILNGLLILKAAHILKQGDLTKTFHIQVWQISSGCIYIMNSLFKPSRIQDRGHYRKMIH